MAIARLLVLSSIFGVAFADPNDWVSVDYVISSARRAHDSTTSEAVASIVLLAEKSAKETPSSGHELSTNFCGY